MCLPKRCLEEYLKRLARFLVIALFTKPYESYNTKCQEMSRSMGIPTICICENTGADQLRSNCEADQRLCFRYSDSTLPLLLKYEISSIWLSSVLVQVGLCRTCSETTLLVFPRGGSSMPWNVTQCARRCCLYSLSRARMSSAMSPLPLFSKALLRQLTCYNKA